MSVVKKNKQGKKSFLTSSRRYVCTCGYCVLDGTLPVTLSWGSPPAILSTLHLSMEAILTISTLHENMKLKKSLNKKLRQYQFPRKRQQHFVGLHSALMFFTTNNPAQTVLSLLRFTTTLPKQRACDYYKARQKVGPTREVQGDLSSFFCLLPCRVSHMKTTGLPIKRPHASIQIGLASYISSIHWKTPKILWLVQLRQKININIPN